MISLRYLTLSGIYVLTYFYSEWFYHPHPTVIFVTTFIFFAIFKYNENFNCTKNKLPMEYLIKHSIFFSLLAIASEYIYEIFLEQECLENIKNVFNSADSYTYVPKSFFIAGIVLLTNNNLSYLIYPKCI